MSKSQLIVLLGIIILFFVTLIWVLYAKNYIPNSIWMSNQDHSIISEENLQEPSPKDTDYQRSLKIINLEKRIKELEELLSKLVVVKQDPYIIDTNTILITNLKEIQFLSRY